MVREGDITRILQIELGTFTPLIFTTTGRSREAFKNNELAESENFLFINKISTGLLTWIQVFKAKTLFELNEVDIEIQTVEGKLG